MAYEFLSHTADIRLKVTAPTLEILFLEALRGMMKILKKEETGEEINEERKISVSSADTTALLIDFLNEVLSNSHIHKEIYPQLVITKFSDTKIEAELVGQKVDSFDKDIKAVTYHEADVKKNENHDFETIIIFDI